MKVTVLIENSAVSAATIEPEFGLSLLIETPSAKVLLDTGASGRFAANADALGIDLATVDWLVLSHGHFDHGGGLEAFFTRNRRAQAIIRRSADQRFHASLAPGMPDFLHRTGLLTRYIGLDQAVLAKYGERIRWVDANTEFAPGFHVLTAIPRTHGLAKGNRFLLVRRDSRFVADDFGHELALVVEQGGEAVLFSGCAHNGVLNMLEAARQALPTRPIRAVIGGFHLNLPRSEKASEPESAIRALARDLGQRVNGPIYTGHCTGAEAFDVLHQELGTRLTPLHTGMHVEI